MTAAIKYLGRGRSAEVYLVETILGRVARKVFTSSTLADLLQVLFFGAPNSYGWNENAIQAAFYRRRVLKKLLRYWFGSELTISDAVNWGWDNEQQVLYLDTEYVEGHKASFAHPWSSEYPDEYEKQKELMRKLDSFLCYAGFAGARWQAGYGQPCANGNFIIRKDGSVVWVDPESAMPAIAACDPRAQHNHYLREWLRLKRPLFDDINLEVLENFLGSIGEDLKQKLHPQEVRELKEDWISLQHYERKWREPSRLLNGLNYRLKHGDLSPERYDYYASSTLRGTGILIQLGARDFLSLAKQKLPVVWRNFKRKLNPFPYLKALLPSHRRKIAEDFVTEGVKEWEEGKRFSEDRVANSAMAGLIELKAGHNRYLSDFGAHLTIWPLGKLISFMVALATIVLARLGHHLSTEQLYWIGFAIIWGDSIARVMYSVVRGTVDRLSGKPFHTVACLFSPIKLIGYFGYGFQMIFTARGEHESEFLIYLLSSHLAKKVPIYGGEYSSIEYRLNRLAWSLIKAPHSVLMVWVFTMLTLPILSLLYLTGWPMPAVSLGGVALSLGLGLWSWCKINAHK